MNNEQGEITVKEVFERVVELGVKVDMLGNRTEDVTGKFRIVAGVIILLQLITLGLLVYGR